MLVSLRGFEEDKGDIIMKYNEEEARKLKAFKELPENGTHPMIIFNSQDRDGSRRGVR